MRRREFITCVVGATAAWPLAARAQKAAGKIQRVGIIDDSPSWNPFRQQLRELNYVEGQNLTYVYLHTDGTPAQLDAAAMVLAQLPVNVIVAFGTPGAKAAQRATKTIPIVAISISDPIAAGLVTSLAHPAGNITGNTAFGLLWPRSVVSARASPKTVGRLPPAYGRCSCRDQSACVQCAPRVALVTPIRASWSRAGSTGSWRRSAGWHSYPRLSRRGGNPLHRQSAFRATVVP